MSESSALIEKIAVITVYSGIFSLLFLSNLALDTDYPYHLHHCWVVSQGYLTLNPYLNGGSSLTLAYGGPAYLMGGLLYPLLERYTVAALMVVGFLLLWWGSSRFFRELTEKHRLATLLVLLNPLTLLYFLTVKLPFLWGAAFSLLSLSSYLRGERGRAVLMGLLGALTHPLSIALLAAVLLVRFEPKRWMFSFLPVYTVALSLDLALMGMPSLLPPAYILAPLSVCLLLGSLLLLFVLEPKARIPCMLAFAVTALALLAHFPDTRYFERLGWFVLLVSTPVIVEKIRLVRLGDLLPLTLLFLAAVPMSWSLARERWDNPPLYENISTDNQLLSKLQEGYVRYSGDGSAIYFLPIGGVRFTNSGFSPLELELQFELENTPEGFLEQLREENASFLLIYPESPEENYARLLGFPLIYERENLRIYRITLETGPRV